MEACPVNALTWNNETGAIIVDEDNCVGCRVCTIACPIGGISIDPTTKTAFKCDLCGGDPECVKICELEAIKLVPRDLLDLQMKRQKSQKISELFALMQSLR
jgi:Fe-S-cluster-containing hydrogenase component 2